MPAAHHAHLLSPPPPIGQAPHCQLDRGSGRPLRLLFESRRREQELPTAAFLREQDAVDDSIAVHPDLPDVTVEVTGGPKAEPADLLHAGEHGRGVGIREPVDELLHGTATRRGPVVAPAPANRTTLTRSRAGSLPWALRRGHPASL